MQVVLTYLNPQPVRKMQLQIHGNNSRIGTMVLANNLLMLISTTWLLEITILLKKYLETMVVFILVNPMGQLKKYPQEISTM